MGNELRFVEDLVAVLRIALAIAVAVFAVAGTWTVLGPVGRWIEVRVLPVVTRMARARHGLAPDAPPWACEPCGSANMPTAPACYHCGVPRPRDAVELRDAATDPRVFHPPVPVNRFDPSRYRGPGASPAAPPGSPPGEAR